MEHTMSLVKQGTTYRLAHRGTGEVAYSPQTGLCYLTAILEDGRRDTLDASASREEMAKRRDAIND